MGIFKKYDLLKNNIKILQARNEDLYKRNIAHQEQYQAELKKRSEEIARLKIELEDTRGFLEQETQAKEALKKERTKLRREITMLKKELNNVK